MEGPLTGQLYLINYESVQAFWFSEKSAPTVGSSMELV